MAKAFLACIGYILVAFSIPLGIAGGFLVMATDWLLAQAAKIDGKAAARFNNIIRPERDERDFM